MQMRPFTHVTDSAALLRGARQPDLKRCQTGVTDQPASMVPVDFIGDVSPSPLPSLDLRPSDDSFPHRKVGINTKTVPGNVSRVCSQQKHGRAVLLRIHCRRHGPLRSAAWWPVPARFRSRATAAEFRNRSRPFRFSAGEYETLSLTTSASQRRLPDGGALFSCLFSRASSNPSGKGTRLLYMPLHPFGDAVRRVNRRHVTTRAVFLPPSLIFSPFSFLLF